ncbi:hypothetical protein BE15_34615 [Sorangium cellulosum]|uniref:Uncharacterized protein n=1 Tax=Sorangium cellulosum TaxID=56 RepID=A0A150Q2D1_SORCE|nr:hypothetical protein BE15_34615 [Sorangium cellulosum]
MRPSKARFGSSASSLIAAQSGQPSPGSSAQSGRRPTCTAIPAAPACSGASRPISPYAAGAPSFAPASGAKGNTARHAARASAPRPTASSGGAARRSSVARSRATASVMSLTSTAVASCSRSGLLSASTGRP